MDWNSLLTWILIALFLIGILAFYQASFKAERKTKNIAFDAIIIAIILVMGLIPQVGYLFILPWLALTLLHIPVLVGASIGGAKRGALYGLVFGLTSMAQAAMNGTGLNAFFVYPWIALPPRIVFGFLAGLFFSLTKRSPKLSGGLGKGVLSFFLTILHTGLVFLTLYAFYPGEIGGYFASSDPVAEGVAITFLVSVLLGALGEATLAAVMVPLIDRPLRKMESARRQ